MILELVRYFLAPVLVAVVGAGGLYWANRAQKGTRENKIIDQLQEQMADLKKDAAEMRERMSRFEARDRVYIPHILRLNMHIEQRLPPPAPPLPRVIAEYLDPQD